MFKLYKDEVPARFNTMFMPNNKTHNYNTCFGNNLRTPKHNINIVKLPLKFMGIKVSLCGGHRFCMFSSNVVNYGWFVALHEK